MLGHLWDHMSSTLHPSTLATLGSLLFSEQAHCCLTFPSCPLCLGCSLLGDLPTSLITSSMLLPLSTLLNRHPGLPIPGLPTSSFLLCFSQYQYHLPTFYRTQFFICFLFIMGHSSLPSPSHPEGYKLHRCEDLAGFSSCIPSPRIKSGKCGSSGNVCGINELIKM